MKSPHWIWLMALLVATVRATFSAEPEVEVGTEPNPTDKTLTILTAARADADKTSKWEPGDEDFLPLKALMDIAKKRGQPPATAKYDPKPLLINVEWIKFSSASQWMMLVRFQFELAVEPGKIMARDGEAFVNVYMLPNGAPIAATKRAMSHKEKVEWGLEKISDKEIEENRRKLDKNDPFYLPPVSK